MLIVLYFVDLESSTTEILCGNCYVIIKVTDQSLSEFSVRVLP